MGTGTGAKIEVSIDNSFFGYNEHIVNLLVPANGGSGTFNWFYSADDVTAGTKTTVGVTAAASGAFALPANIPIGVAFTDIYQDINGKYLNYRMHEDGYHVLTDWYVEVPFVNIGQQLVTGMSGIIPVNGNAANSAIWRDVRKNFTYLTVDTVANTVTPGVHLKSDGIGNYVIEAPAAPAGTTVSGGVFTGTASSYFLAPRTAQTVGKLIALDTRMPKDYLENVLTYPRSGMPGSQTAGITKNLFDFAYYSMSAVGTAPTIENIYEYIQRGVFGLARIQLLVS
jgi:hypothetical protein